MRTEIGFGRRSINAAIGLVVWGAMIGGLPALGQEKPKDATADAETKGDKPVSFWMDKKLEYSQHILSGLALEDFEKIGRTAQAMQRLGKIETFVRRHDTEAYRTQFRVFQFANEELIRLAAEKNIDGAALAFTQLTLSCVNCHKQLRGAK